MIPTLLFLLQAPSRSEGEEENGEVSSNIPGRFTSVGSAGSKISHAMNSVNCAAHVLPLALPLNMKKCLFLVFRNVKFQ